MWPHVAGWDRHLPTNSLCWHIACLQSERGPSRLPVPTSGTVCRRMWPPLHHCRCSDNAWRQFCSTAAIRTYVLSELWQKTFWCVFLSVHSVYTCIVTTNCETDRDRLCVFGYTTFRQQRKNNIVIIGPGSVLHCNENSPSIEACSKSVTTNTLIVSPKTYSLINESESTLCLKKSHF